MAAATPLLGHFLIAINGFVQARNEIQLADYLVLEPPFGPHYVRMIEELRTHYPSGSEDAIEAKCQQLLAAAREGAEGSPWSAFVKFMAQYLRHLRDVDPDPRRYLETYELLSELQLRANSALAHGALGSLMLPVVVANARLVCRLAIGLDKQPQLMAHLRSAQHGGAGPGEDDGGTRETLPERAANILRTAFVTCLNDRVSGVDDAGRPQGKKRGIYRIANLCLRILFQCRKTRNATQIFENIHLLSPPLAAYPKCERVTYLYYLGRFLFQHSHFARASLALQYAYDQSPARPDCVSQRRLLLVYLITSNILLGRFPSLPHLLSRPEAAGMAPHFSPICAAIRSGDLSAFRTHLDFTSPSADWFLRFRILLPLRNRGEVLVWRSLVRRTWCLAGVLPRDPFSRAAPTITISALATAFTFAARSSSAHDYDALAIESVLSSLIDQGLLGGFVSHRQAKFAITGSKIKGGPLRAGFPLPSAVLSARAQAGESRPGEVPGWKQAASTSTGGLLGPGSVVKLSGARPVGVF